MHSADEHVRRFCKKHGLRVHTFPQNSNFDSECYVICGKSVVFSAHELRMQSSEEQVRELVELRIRKIMP